MQSVIMLMFREEKSPEDEIKAWQFWHSRQHSVKQRILDAGKLPISHKPIISNHFQSFPIVYNHLQSFAIAGSVECVVCGQK